MAMSTPLWQRLIWAVAFLVVCEGALRKWVFPGLQAEIYLVKDAVLVAAYIGFLSTRRSGVHLQGMTGLRILLICSLFYFGLELFNPNSPSPVLSAVGFKNYLLYVPLAFVVPYMFSSCDDFERKLRKYAIIMIPFAALGVVQFAFGPDHWINGYLSHDSENLRTASMFGSGEVPRARTSGTFSFIGGFTTFLTVMLYLGIGLMTNEKWRISGNVGLLALIVITIAAIFTTGSRGPIYGLMMTAPLVFCIWGVRGIVSMRSLLKMAFACIAISILVAFIVPEAIEAYQYRAQTSDDPIGRILSPIIELYDAVQASPVIGTGMASTNGVAITIMGTDSWWWLDGQFVEAETARVLQETGIVGFVLVYAARLWLLVKAITLGVRFRTPLYVAMSGVIAGFFAQYVALIVINNPTGGIYYWFAAGLLFAMYRLESQEATAPLIPSAWRRRQLARSGSEQRQAPPVQAR